MKQKILLALLVCLISQGCKEDGLIEDGKASVLKKLNDPSSAQFLEVRISGNPGAQYVCGKVNAKNKFGGYEGFRPFVFDTRIKEGAIIYGGSGITDDILSQLAQMKGFVDLCGH